jgi:hypothetical protein
VRIRRETNRAVSNRHRFIADLHEASIQSLEHSVHLLRKTLQDSHILLSFLLRLVSIRKAEGLHFARL